MLKFIETNTQGPREAKEIYAQLKRIDNAKTGRLPREEIEQGYYQIVQDRATASLALEDTFKQKDP